MCKETKKCAGCKIKKPINSFNKNRSRADGYSHYCKGCKRLLYLKTRKPPKPKPKPKQITHKKCHKCQVKKAVASFYKNKSRKDGYNNWCKSCRKLWSQENEKLKDYRRQYYLNNKEEIYKTAKKRLRNLSPEEKERRRELARKRDKKKYWSDPEAARKKAKKKRSNPKAKKRLNAYLKRRRKEDPEFRMRKALRGAVRKALKRKNAKKIGSATKHLGCTIQELKIYLEKQFQPGMTWENYGPEWHIDHIKALANFDLSDPKQFAEACHYTNLQPLWAEENIKKSNLI